MQVFGQRPQFDPRYTTDHYDWASLGGARVVFFGGGSEHVALALARQFADLRVVVQTLPQAVGSSTVPEELQERVRFMAHDLFRPQPVRDADVYLLRWCLHNWSNKYCVLMLRALVPALKDGARVILQETIMPEPGAVALWKEKNTRSVATVLQFDDFCISDLALSSGPRTSIWRLHSMARKERQPS